MQKKILHFIDSGGLYGAEKVLLNISSEMIHEGDFLPVVGCIVQTDAEDNDLYMEALRLGIDAERLRINNKNVLIDIWRVARKLRSMSIVCIHSHGYKPSVFGFLISRLTGIPIIATCHLWYMGGKRPFTQRAMIWMELFLYKFFPKIIAVSMPIKQFLIFSGVSENKVVIIKNGISLIDHGAEGQSSLGKYRKELGVPEDAFLLLNVARLSEQKAQDGIIAAARVLKKQHVKFALMIVGEGPLRNKYEELIRQWDLRDCVKLLGFRTDIKELLAVADCFLLPSRDEGLPIALLEAMAARTPAVVTAVGDIPELLTHKQSALFVPVDDSQGIVHAVTWMMNHKEQREEMTEAAYAMVRDNYSAAVMYKEYREIYETFIHH